ncbi:tRNA (guanine-N7-)-methyltransferase [Inhella inkyongensis]|uniref:tRNA (guanine-N(7)-)-methyltransferase n=2 Tax=Inhella inkyongensis TaxID=392593 RepID=A0A840S5X9_9BURK|nr:tRNA (guanosine(46)-N7)-methyltransferase TrmB [Inhella inkyongensis]MBB5204021.1 tRNA (guanine-N7-)-methyltransferase [Inhella inkyongensis]
MDEQDCPAEDQAATPVHARRVKSFVKRGGRMGTGQIKALQELAPKYMLPYAEQAPGLATDWDGVFGRQAPRVLEIGFGMGDATAKIAATLPHIDFIGCEVHEAGVGALLQRIDEGQLTNLRIVQHDAVEVLERMIPKASLAGVHLFFPDPWHKKRHHKRRLVQPAFIKDLLQYLAPGAYFHAATDWEPYAQQMLEVLSAEGGLKNRFPGYAEKPDYRPLTKFEARGLRLGHGVWDLVFEKV